MERLDTAGSTLFTEIWKRRRTPLGLQWAHTTGGPISVGVSISPWPGPQKNGGEAGHLGSGSDPIRNLVKAGALLAAEIDRLTRAQLAKEQQERTKK